MEVEMAGLEDYKDKEDLYNIMLHSIIKYRENDEWRNGDLAARSCEAVGTRPTFWDTESGDRMEG